MQTTPLLQGKSLKVIAYRCTMGPDDAPFLEQHTGHSLSYVRKGSFGYDTRGRTHRDNIGEIAEGVAGDCARPPPRRGERIVDRRPRRP
jgi:hypothetical protein